MTEEERIGKAVGKLLVDAICSIRLAMDQAYGEDEVGRHRFARWLADDIYKALIGLPPDKEKQ